MGFFGRVVPAPVIEPIKAFVRWWDGQPPIDGVDLTALRRVRPISRAFGAYRGEALHRSRFERFLDSCREDIRGRVWEIGEGTYKRRFGRHGNVMAARSFLQGLTTSEMPAAKLDLADPGCQLLITLPAAKGAMT